MKTLDSLVSVDTSVSFASPTLVLNAILNNIEEQKDTLPVPDAWTDRLQAINDTIDSDVDLTDQDKNFLYGMYLLLDS